MAIFGQVPREELGTRFTHYGWFAGCPVYLGNLASESPLMVERNWVPSWWFAFVTEAFGFAIFLRTLMDDDYEPMWPMLVTGEIE